MTSAPAPEVEAEMECPECGATETASGNPFDKGRLNRHIQGAHPDLWAQIRDEEAIAPPPTRGRGRPPKDSKPAPAPKPKKDREDITAGLQANIAVVALLLGARSPYKGSVITSFAPRLASSANASAQAGPDWYYQAFAMASVGGAHMDLVVTVMALVVALAAEKNPKHRDKLPALRMLGMPVPAAPWEDPGTVRMPARPHPGPVTVDLEPDPQDVPANPPPPANRTAVPEAAATFAPGSPADERTEPHADPRPPDAPRQTIDSTPPPADFLGGMNLDLSALTGLLSPEDMAQAAELAAQMFKNGGHA